MHFLCISNVSSNVSPMQQNVKITVERPLRQKAKIPIKANKYICIFSGVTRMWEVEEMMPKSILFKLTLLLIFSSGKPFLKKGQS